MKLASGLLKAYGELRQLVPLLESLAAALGSPKCPASASAVIQDAGFLEQVQKALPCTPFRVIMADVASSHVPMPEPCAQIGLEWREMLSKPCRQCWRFHRVNVQLWCALRPLRQSLLFRHGPASMPYTP